MSQNNGNQKGGNRSRFPDIKMNKGKWRRIVTHTLGKIGTTMLGQLTESQVSQWKLETKEYNLGKNLCYIGNEL